MSCKIEGCENPAVGQTATGPNTYTINKYCKSCTIQLYESKTLTMITAHFTKETEEKFGDNGEAIDFPFHLEDFCREMDEYILSLKCEAKGQVDD